MLAAASASAAGHGGQVLDAAVDVLLTRFWDDEHGVVVAPTLATALRDDLLDCE